MIIAKECERFLCRQVVAMMARRVIRSAGEACLLGFALGDGGEFQIGRF